MAQWAVIIPAHQWATERLYHNESVTLAEAADQESHDGGRSHGGGPAPDEEVLLVADDHVVALARVAKTDGVLAPAPAATTGDDDLVLTYLRRAFDDPVPAAGLLPAGTPAGRPVEVEAAVFRRLTAALAGEPGEPGPGTPTWLVSLALPIEAATPADAVRQFWTHVAELGPKELPTYVWPSGDELAMQAFVLGEEANQDPEDDEED